MAETQYVSAICEIKIICSSLKIFSKLSPILKYSIFKHASFLSCLNTNLFQPSSSKCSLKKGQLLEPCKVADKKNSTSAEEMASSQTEVKKGIQEAPPLIR